MTGASTPLTVSLPPLSAFSPLVFALALIVCISVFSMFPMAFLQGLTGAKLCYDWGIYSPAVKW